MTIAAVESSYEASAQSIKPQPGHIHEINGIDSPSSAEMRREILQDTDFNGLYCRDGVMAAARIVVTPAFPLFVLFALDPDIKKPAGLAPGGSIVPT